MWFEQDVAWHNHHSHIFGSVGDDKQLIIWDTRQRCESGSSLIHYAQSQIDTGLAPFYGFKLVL